MRKIENGRQCIVKKKKNRKTMKEYRGKSFMLKAKFPKKSYTFITCNYLLQCRYIPTILY